MLYYSYCCWIDRSKLSATLKHIYNFFFVSIKSLGLFFLFCFLQQALRYFGFVCCKREILCSLFHWEFWCNFELEMCLYSRFSLNWSRVDASACGFSQLEWLVNKFRKDQCFFYWNDRSGVLGFLFLLAVIFAWVQLMGTGISCH